MDAGATSSAAAYQADVLAGLQVDNINLGIGRATGPRVGGLQEEADVAAGDLHMDRGDLLRVRACDLICEGVGSVM